MPDLGKMNWKKRPSLEHTKHENKENCAGLYVDQNFVLGSSIYVLIHIVISYLGRVAFLYRGSIPTSDSARGHFGSST